MTCGIIAHVFVFHDIFIVDEYLRISWETVATVFMHIQLFVIVSVVSARATPGGEGADLCLGPWGMRVVEC